MPPAQDYVVYYLCGYLVNTFLKPEKCAACIREIHSSLTECSEAFLALESSSILRGLYLTCLEALKLKSPIYCKKTASAWTPSGTSWIH